MTVDETHRRDLRSWVESANVPDTDFPIQNLPFGVFRRRASTERPRVGVAIGDRIVDVPACLRAGLLHDAKAVAETCQEGSLNALAAAGNDAVDALRRALSALLRAGASIARPWMRDDILVPMAKAELQRPVQVSNYTDFYTSIAHATNLGSFFRPDNPLLPNYKYVPIGYHGRASSVVVSGTPVRRPMGQLHDDAEAPPVFAPSRRLDYELELGAIIGRENSLGTRVSVREAARHLFGFCLVNDWSARDIQTWEYQPLGPFLAKSFATTMSPWVVTTSALAPFRAPAYPRPAGDPPPLPHLSDAEDQRSGGLDIIVEVALRTAAMRERGDAPVPVSRSCATEMYWTFAQLVAHHTSNGCNLCPGDLLASGTISGRAKNARGSLIELAWRGTEPLALPGGESRAFLHDGDEVVMRAWCERDGCARIGFGECRGLVLPATP